MTTLFISDLHLCSERPEITGLFLEFLAAQTEDCDGLYILGDLFEVWLGDDAICKDQEPILQALLELEHHGIPLYVMHGNRDFLLGPGFEEMSGCQLIPDPTIIELDNEAVMLMHGDTLCSDDIEYQQFRSQVRNPAYIREFLGKPLDERKKIASYYRGESRSRSRKKPVEIMDVNPDTVVQTMMENNVRWLIHGHTHRPAIHTVEFNGESIHRIVLGDWYQQGSFLLHDEDGFHLEKLPL